MSNNGSNRNLCTRTCDSGRSFSLVLWAQHSALHRYLLAYQRTQPNSILAEGLTEINQLEEQKWFIKHLFHTNRTPDGYDILFLFKDFHVDFHKKCRLVMQVFAMTGKMN